MPQREKESGPSGADSFFALQNPFPGYMFLFICKQGGVDRGWKQNRLADCAC
jgi:hypothetical protein